MSLVSIRAAVQAAVSAAVPRLATCETHGGRFDVDELKRVASRTPAAYVAVLGVHDLVESGGESEGDLALAVFVVTGDSRSASRDSAALAIVQALGLLIPGNRWGLDDAVGVPGPVTADNLYSGGADRSGVALWGLAWKQRFSLGNGLDPADLAVFATFDAGYARGADGAPLAEDLVELPQEE